MRTWIAALFIFAAGSSTLAQEVPPALLVVNQGEAKAITLRQVKVQLKVEGLLAETRTTMTFCNPFSRVLEGTLHFPLPDGATVSGYAIDVGTTLVDGVIVEKEKGQVVFEKEVRKGVDPGLIEWTKGNNFKTRIYPIPANGCRTVAVSYVASLNGNNNGLSFSVPLNYKDNLEKFALDIRVAGLKNRPKVTWPGPGGIQLAEKNGGFYAEASMQNRPLFGQLVLNLTEPEVATTIVEKSPNDETHLFVRDVVAADPNLAPDGGTKAPARVTVLWDVSGSRGQNAHAKELELLTAYFARFAGNSIAVDLVPFSNSVKTAVKVTVAGGNTDALFARIRALTYDGGTQMAAITPEAKAGVPDLYLLFSDGLSNFGSADAKGFLVPVYGFSSDVTLNSIYLTWLTQHTGGDFFNLNQIPSDKAALAIGGAKLALMAVYAKDGRIDQVYPQPGQPIHDQLILTGKLLTPTATVVVEIGVGGKISKRTEYVLARDNGLEGNLLARFWAQQRVNHLAVFPEQNHKALLEIGKKYGLVTPATSLIVLERLEQYVEHEIRPPASLKQMRADYDQQIAARAEQQKSVEEQKLEHILDLWKQRVEWWNTKFKHSAHVKGEGGEEESNAQLRRPGGAAGATMAMPSEPAPMMEPAAPPAASSAAMDKDDSAGPRERRAASPAKTSAAGNDEGAPGNPNPTIELKPWSPDTPYLKALEDAAAASRFAVYLQQKKTYGTSPAFFLDCADFFANVKDKELALQVLSNIAELEIDSAPLLRVLAHRLHQLGHMDLAVMIFEDVLRLRPEEPQSYRDLALVLADQENYPRAMQLLSHVVMNQWARFDEIETIALMELNRIIPKAKAKGIEDIPIDPRLIKLLDLDIRISLSWDADLTDIDLWVIEPSGERAYYGHNRTTIGGLVSRDFTQGYGPEEYVIKTAMPGQYVVKTNFFGSSAQSLTGAVTLQLELFTNYGRPNEKRQSITIRLTQAKETFTVGTLKF